jgi:hypothetical protein
LLLLAFVIPGLDPGIHALRSVAEEKTWMAGTNPAMTSHVKTKEAGMTAYLISLALAGLLAIAVWEALS